MAGGRYNFCVMGNRQMSQGGLHANNGTEKGF